MTTRLETVLTRDSDRYRAFLAEIAERSRGREEQLEGFTDLVELLRSSGFSAFRVPVEYGGSGGSIEDLLAIVADIAQVNPNLAHIVRTHFAFVEARLRSTRERERAYWLRRAAAGELFANLAGELSASAVGRLRVEKFSTTVTSDATGRHLSGEKFYSTGSPYVDLLAVSASVASDGRSVTAVVPRRREGVRLLHDWDGFGQRLTGSGTTVFDDVAVGDDELIEDGEGSGTDLNYYVLGQIYILAMQVGILRGVVDDGIALLRSRTRNFSTALAADPVNDPQLWRVVGELASVAALAGDLVRSAARAFDRAMATVLARDPDPSLAREFAVRIARAKVVIDQAGPYAANLLFDLGGASSTRGRLNLDRHWRNIRTVSTHNPAATKARLLGQFLIDEELESPALW
ncbi:acyl-CoA dehydrogenase family protein [Acrocarpospora catenulata]|uniref:acyl-CoA dehydrogenase family protein n=1 Tax=Acrocarpospora catenulata TaxID=2836182 RepID=UPI001BDB6A1A|nr:acyl-CoA dehydrogenase family protein [Acrocarpospora catenulata]